MTLPKPPTPPTPPTAPKVELNEGGTVRESTVPQDKKQTGEEKNEALARQSVADGNGALTKKKVTTPETKENNHPAKASQPKEVAPQKSPVESVPDNVSADEQRQADMSVFTEDKTGESTAVASNLPAEGNGSLYWGGIILGAILLAGVLVKFLAGKKGTNERRPRRPRKNGLGGDDDLSGLKIDEALAKMAAETPSSAASSKEKTAKQDVAPERPTRFEVRV